MQLKLSLVGLHKQMKRFYRLIMAGLFIIAFALGTYIFYQYVYLATQEEIDIATVNKSINREVLDEVLKNIESRENSLDNVKNIDFPNIFSQ